MARVACDRLHGEGADLFGRGNRPGLLELVGDGTLLLTNLHQVWASLLSDTTNFMLFGSSQKSCHY